MSQLWRASVGELTVPARVGSVDVFLSEVVIPERILHMLEQTGPCMWVCTLRAEAALELVDHQLFGEHAGVLVPTFCTM